MPDPPKKSPDQVLHALKARLSMPLLTTTLRNWCHCEAISAEAVSFDEEIASSLRTLLFAFPLLMHGLAHFWAEIIFETRTNLGDDNIFLYRENPRENPALSAFNRGLVALFFKLTK